jgi:hypothetical protein
MTLLTFPPFSHFLFYTFLFIIYFFIHLFVWLNNNLIPLTEYAQRKGNRIIPKTLSYKYMYYFFYLIQILGLYT